jgi:membrane fusion protein (multidrug efflux system)
MLVAALAAVALQGGVAQAQALLPLTCLLTPLRTSDIGSDRSGIVTVVEVGRADLVAAGDALVRIDTTLAEADLEVARNTVAALEERLARNEALVGRNLIPLDEIGALRADLALARAEEARARMEIDRATIRAPFAGYVTEVNVAPGELIGVEPLLRLIEVSRLRAELVYRAEAWGEIAPGQAIPLRVELAGADVEGVVTAIDPFIDASSDTFTVIAEIANPDLALPAGTSCAVRG